MLPCKVVLKPRTSPHMSREPEPADKNSNGQEKKMVAKGYTTKEFADFYGISPKAFRTWIEPFEECIGERLGRYFTPKQVRIIVEKLGPPGELGIMPFILIRIFISFEQLPRMILHAVA